MKKHLKDFFIPHEGNEYKPHSLQKIAFTGMVIMVFLSFAVANFQSILWVTSDWMVSAVLPSVILDLANEERADASLSTLRRNPKLDEAAQLKAQDMAKYSYFAHFSPTGVSPWYWFSQAGYNFVNAGENLAIHFNDTQQLMDAWMESPTHRANLMNAAYTETGIGTAEGTFEGYDTVFVVQMFGTPAAEQPVVAGAQVTEVQPVQAVSPEPAIDTEVQTTPAVAPPEETEVLAEEVSLSEEVIIVAADPEPIVVTEVATKTAAQETDIIDMEVTENGIELYSDLISTTTGGIPASLDPTEIQTANEAPYSLEILTQPRLLLQLMYAFIGIFVLGSLLLSIFIEIRRQHPVQIAYSVALLALMSGLLYIHTTLSGGAVVL